MTTSRSNQKKETLNFEQSLTELNQLVDNMEQGGLSLEESLKSFEKGIGLIRHCQEALQRAEQTVKVLTEQQTLESYQQNDKDE